VLHARNGVVIVNPDLILVFLSSNGKLQHLIDILAGGQRVLTGTEARGMIIRRMHERNTDMLYVPLILIAAAAAAGAVHYMNRKEPENPGISSETVVSLSMDQIELLLARLEREEPPEPRMGAMCYAPMMIPDSAEYICPACGEKTMYGGGMFAYMNHELEAARRLAESIDAATDFSVVLDESSFCEFCSVHGVGSAVLVLRVVGENGEETSNSVSVDDLRKLDAFLKGSLCWTTSNDGQEPLQRYAGRMRELLGI